MKRALFSLLICGTLLAQAPRPPTSLLDQLSDVTITSPTDKQPLVYDTASAKWINSSTLTDIVIYNSVDGDNAADFSSYVLSNKGANILDWSNGVLMPLVPIVDASDAKSIDTDGRKLYKTDGTTVLFDWSGTNPQFPTLTNSASNAFLTTDASGNVSVATVPNAGTIPPTADVILKGDGSGNAIQSGFTDSLGNHATYGSSYNGLTDLRIFNTFTGIGGATEIGLQSDSSTAKFRKMGTATSAIEPLSGPDDAILTAGTTGDLLLLSDNNFVFGAHSSSTQWAQIGGAGGLSVGTTTMPGAGVINVSSGYRIGNAASYNHSLVGNGTSFVSGDVPGKASVTSTVDQTATTETAHVVYTVPANSVSVGTVFRIHASGNVDNGTTGITFTPRLRWGGTGGTAITATPTFTSSTTSNTNRAYVLDATLTVRTTGATGTISAEVWFIERSTSLSGGETVHVDNQGATPVTIDTTANKDLDLTWTLSATTGTPHIRTISGFVEVVKP